MVTDGAPGVGHNSGIDPHAGETDLTASVPALDDRGAWGARDGQPGPDDAGPQAEPPASPEAPDDTAGFLRVGTFEEHLGPERVAQIDAMLDREGADPNDRPACLELATIYSGPAGEQQFANDMALATQWLDDPVLADRIAASPLASDPRFLTAIADFCDVLRQSHTMSGEANRGKSKPANPKEKPMSDQSIQDERTAIRNDPAYWDSFSPNYQKLHTRMKALTRRITPDPDGTSATRGADGLHQQGPGFRGF